MAESPQAGEGEETPKVVVHPVVFGVSACLIVAVSAFGAAVPTFAAEVFSAIQGWIVHTFGWFYMLCIAVFLIFVLYLAFSRFGAVRLGPDGSEPEYSRLSWFAMLFSAGIGIGLLFFGVAEPLLHFASPPAEGIDGQTPEAARFAMNATFLHWGVHGWAVYVLIGLALAYFAYRHHLPLTLRSALYPLLGERIHGPIGNAVDIAAVIGTVFGVATSLGLGVLQVNAGLNYLFGVPEAPWVQVSLIAAITLMATASVVAGLDAGIKRLSELNMVLAVALLVVVFALGPTVFLLSAFLQNVGAYASELVALTFRQFAYQPNEWLGGWTLFYWAWWMAWAPFVGMFIARISRGRTIREFVVGVLLAPSLFIFFWMTVFGDSAIHAVLVEAQDRVLVLAQNNMPLALFGLLERLPFGFFLSVLSLILIVTFFVTSSDSGSLVVDMLASGGVENPPVWQRIFWALTQGLIAAVLLLAGGLGALQTAALTSGLPLAVVLLAVGFGLYTALSREAQAQARYEGPPLPVATVAVDWRRRLKQLVRHHDRRAAEAFLRETARPAFESVVLELRALEVHAELRDQGEALAVEVIDASGDEPLVLFAYGVQLRSYRTMTFTVLEPQKEAARRHWYAEAWCSTTGERYDVMGVDRHALIDDLLSHYSRWVAARTAPQPVLEPPTA